MKNYEIYGADTKNRIYFSLILIFMLSFGLMYISTVIELKGDIVGLRAEHLDIPSSASDTMFQIKNIVCLFIGLFMIAGPIGLIARYNWGIQASVAGLFGQAGMYIAEIVIFRSQTFNYPPAQAIVVIILIDIIVMWKLYKEKAIQQG